MIEITKEFTFDMAHMLENHPGKCKNLHGHTYKLKISATSIFDNNYDMVVDFADLKNFVNTLVVDKMDHAFAYKKTTTDVCEKAIAEILEQNGRKTIAFDFRPTAERMAEHIYKSLNFACVMESKTYRISKVELFETPTSYATYKDE